MALKQADHPWLHFVPRLLVLPEVPGRWLNRFCNNWTPGFGHTSLELFPFPRVLRLGPFSLASGTHFSMPLSFAICALISGKHFRWGQALLAVDGIARTPVPQKYWPLRPFPVLWYYKMWRQCLLRGKDSFLFLPLSSEVSDVRCIWEIKVRLTILIYAGFVDPKQCIFYRPGRFFQETQRGLLWAFVVPPVPYSDFSAKEPLPPVPQGCPLILL